MSYWKENINYRQEKTVSGIRYLITIDSEDVEVTEEVYKAYTQMERRERYLIEAEEGIVISLEQLIDDEVKVECLSNQYVESAEEIVIEAENEQKKNDVIRRLYEAMNILNADEQLLIKLLFFENKTERAAAEYFRISQPAVHKRRLKILQKLKKYMEN